MTKSTRTEAARPLLVPVRHPDGADCAWRGREYQADSDGIVLVPPEAVMELTAHGFVPVGRRAK